MSSPEPRAILFAPRAQVDIQDIFFLGLAIGGEPQARTYDPSLRRAIRRLAAFPELGRARNDVHPGCRSFLVGEHALFYDTGVHPAEGPTIRIRRILHKSRHVAGQVRD